jgi:hypothetical protein
MLESEKKYVNPIISKISKLIGEKIDRQFKLINILMFAYRDLYTRDYLFEDFNQRKIRDKRMFKVLELVSNQIRSSRGLNYTMMSKLVSIQHINIAQLYLDTKFIPNLDYVRNP